MGFSRQEYWRGLPFPSPGDLPNPGFKLRSPTLQADALTSEPRDEGSPRITWRDTNAMIRMADPCFLNYKNYEVTFLTLQDNQEETEAKL